MIILYCTRKVFRLFYPLPKMSFDPTNFANAAKSQTKQSIQFALFGIVIVVTLALFSKWSDNNDDRMTTTDINSIKYLVKRATQYQIESKQDINPIVSLMHSANAIACINAARSIATDAQIVRITRIKPSELQYYLESDYDKAIQNLSAKCPTLKPSATYMAASGWV